MEHVTCFLQPSMILCTKLASWASSSSDTSKASAGCSRRKAQSLGQETLPSRWDTLASSQSRLESVALESCRGRKASNNASVNALAQRRYHQKLKVCELLTISLSISNSD